MMKRLARVIMTMALLTVVVAAIAPVAHSAKRGTTVKKFSVKASGSSIKVSGLAKFVDVPWVVWTDPEGDALPPYSVLGWGTDLTKVSIGKPDPFTQESLELTWEIADPMPGDVLGPGVHYSTFLTNIDITGGRPPDPSNGPFFAVASRTSPVETLRAGDEYDPDERYYAIHYCKAAEETPCAVGAGGPGVPVAPGAPLDLHPTTGSMDDSGIVTIDIPLELLERQGGDSLAFGATKVCPYPPQRGDCPPPAYIGGVYDDAGWLSWDIPKATVKLGVGAPSARTEAVKLKTTASLDAKGGFSGVLKNLKPGSYKVVVEACYGKSNCHRVSKNVSL